MIFTEKDGKNFFEQERDAFKRIEESMRRLRERVAETDPGARVIVWQDEIRIENVTAGKEEAIDSILLDWLC